MVDHLRRPGHAGVFGRDLDMLGRAPVHQVGGFVYHQVVAAGGTGIVVALFVLSPAASVVDAQVGGDDEESVALGGAVHVGIAQTQLADGAGDHGLAAVHVREVASVLTDREVDLFLVRAALADEVAEQVAHIIVFRNGRGRCLYSDADVLRGGVTVLCEGRGQSDSGIACSSGDHTGGLAVCFGVCDDCFIGAGPGDCRAFQLVDQGNVAAYRGGIGDREQVRDALDFLIAQVFLAVCVGLLHPVQLGLGQVHDGAVALLERVEGVFAGPQDLPGVLGVVHVLNIGCDDRQIAGAGCVLVREEAVLGDVGVRPVLLVEAEEFRALQGAVVDPAVPEPGQTGQVQVQLIQVVDLFPGGVVQQVLRLHDADAAVRLRVVAVLGGAVVPVADLDDRGVDDFSGRAALRHAVGLVVDQKFGFGEVHKVSGRHIIDRVGLCLVLRLRIHDAGCEEDDVLAGFLVVDHFRGPGHAGVFGGDLDMLGRAPVHQVGGFVNDQIVAAGGAGIIVALFVLFPAASVVDAQVGRDDEESVALGRAVHVGVTQTQLADGAGDHGLPAVHVREVASVLADCEVDLLLIRAALADEVAEQVAHIIVLRHRRGRSLDGDFDFLCGRAGGCGKNDLLIDRASCYDACGLAAGSLIGNDFGVAARPGDLCAVERFHKSDIAADLRCAGDLQCSQIGDLGRLGAVCRKDGGGDQTQDHDDTQQKRDAL